MIKHHYYEYTQIMSFMESMKLVIAYMLLFWHYFTIPHTPHIHTLIYICYIYIYIYVFYIYIYSVFLLIVQLIPLHNIAAFINICRFLNQCC